MAKCRFKWIKCLIIYNKKVAKIIVFQAAMPTLATAAVLSDDKGLNAELSYVMVGFGVILLFFYHGFLVGGFSMFRDLILIKNPCSITFLTRQKKRSCVHGLV